eukprot:14189992-Alexandrium_andersonii.AAC.1
MSASLVGSEMCIRDSGGSHCSTAWSSLTTDPASRIIMTRVDRWTMTILGPEKICIKPAPDHLPAAAG